MSEPLDTAPAAPDVSNMFGVGTSVDGQRVAIHALRMGVMPGLPPLTRGQALNLTAWLVVLLDPELKELGPLMQAIKKT